MSLMKTLTKVALGYAVARIKLGNRVRAVGKRVAGKDLCQIGQIVMRHAQNLGQIFVERDQGRC